MRRNELVPPASGLRGPAYWRDEFGNHTPVGGDRDPLPVRFADVAAQVVFELPDAGLHGGNIATCGHIGNSR